MKIMKIETPAWNGDIKEILEPYKESFDFKGIPDDFSLDKYEWWKVCEGEHTLGIGWIDIMIMFTEN